MKFDLWLVTSDGRIPFSSSPDSPPWTLLYDGVGTSVGGLLGQRLRFQARAEAVRGQVGVTGTKPYHAYRGAAVLSMAASRYVSLNASYMYSRHEFRGNVALPPGSLAYADRHGARVFVSTLLPLYSRTRRPDATR